MKCEYRIDKKIFDINKDTPGEKNGFPKIVGLKTKNKTKTQFLQDPLPAMLCMLTRTISDDLQAGFVAQANYRSIYS